LAPHRLALEGKTAIYWTDSCVVPRLRGFVVDMTLAAVAAMTCWLAGVRLPWGFRFNLKTAVEVQQNCSNAVRLWV
jgi:hypothetical protein